METDPRERNEDGAASRSGDDTEVGDDGTEERTSEAVPPPRSREIHGGGTQAQAPNGGMWANGVRLESGAWAAGGKNERKPTQRKRGKNAAAQGRPKSMSHQENQNGPWEVILGLTGTPGREARESLTRAVSHLERGLGGGRQGSGTRYGEWRAFANDEGGGAQRGPTCDPDDRDKNSCRPTLWKRTWASLVNELWNDPGARHALEVVREGQQHSVVGPLRIQTGACRVYNTTRARNRGRCTCAQQARRWMQEHQAPRDSRCMQEGGQDQQHYGPKHAYG